MPKGYGFLKKGIKYKTLHARRLTHEAGKTVYVVEHNKKVLGIRVPRDILSHVHSQANDTLSSRKLAIERRDTAALRQASEELASQFPKIPESDRDWVLKHGFKKYSGRVGRTSMIPLPRKVLYAVIAHIRHTRTLYDEHLRAGMDRDKARTRIQGEVQTTLEQWGSTQDLSWYFNNPKHIESEEAMDDA